MKGNEMNGVTTEFLNVNSDAEREAYQRAIKQVMELLMQILSNAVFLSDRETLQAIQDETESLFRQAHKMLSEGTKPDVMAGPAGWAL